MSDRIRIARLKAVKSAIEHAKMDYRAIVEEVLRVGDPVLVTGRHNWIDHGVVEKILSDGRFAIRRPHHKRVMAFAIDVLDIDIAKLERMSKT